jgi:hypothetical protein
VEVPDRRWIVEHLAVLAVALPDVGIARSEAVAQLRAYLDRFVVTDVSIVREAAAFVPSLPQPTEEAPEETELAGQIKEHLGLASTETQLEAMFTARELLGELADDLEK